MAPASTRGCRAARSVTLLAAVNGVCHLDGRGRPRAAAHAGADAVFGEPRDARPPSSQSASCRGSSSTVCPADWTTIRSSSIRRGRPDRITAEALRDFLRLKYQGHRFDLVIAMDHTALEFVEKTRDQAVRRRTRRLLLQSPCAAASGKLHGCQRATQPGWHARSRDADAAGRGGGVRRHRHRQELREPRPCPIRCVRITVLVHLSIGAADHGAGAAAGCVAAAIHRLLHPRGPGWRQRDVRPLAVSGARRGGRQRAHLLLGGLRDGSRDCRRQPAKPDGPDGCGGQSGSARPAGRARRRHSRGGSRSEQHAGRLAAAAALEYQRGARAGGNHCPIPHARRVERYGLYIAATLAIVLAQSALIAGLLLQRARRQQAEARARDQSERAAGELRAHPRSRRAPALRAGRRARAHRPRAAR